MNMKKVSLALVLVLVSIAGFSQRTDSVQVKMSVQEFQTWNNYIYSHNNSNKDKIDALMKLVMDLRDNAKSLDTSMGFLNGRAAMLPKVDSAGKKK